MNAMKSDDMGHILKGMQMPNHIAQGIMSHANILTGQQGIAQVGEIQALRKALSAAGDWVRKSSIGTQQQGSAFASVAGSELAPLVPQSIDNILHSQTVTQEELVLWPMLMKMGFVDATSHIHETNVVTDVRHGMDPFLAAGSNGPNAEEQFARKTVQIKFMGRREIIDDMSAVVGMTGFNGLVPRNALDVKTQVGTIGLLNSLDLQIAQADSTLSPLAFDGLYKQIVTQNDGAAWYTAGLRRNVANSANYYDAGGAALTPQFLIERAGELAIPPTVGYPNKFLMTPQHHQALRNQALAFSRTSGMMGGDLYFGPTGQLYVAGPKGPIECVAVPHLVREANPPTAAIGDTPPIATFADTAVITAAAGSANSKFTAAFAGDYFYKIVAVGDKGQTLASDMNSHAAVTIPVGGKASIDVKEKSVSSQGATSDSATVGSIRYFRVYRSDKGGALSTCKYLFSFPVNTSGTGTSTLIVDENYNQPNSGPVIAIKNDPAQFYWANLLGLIRRPLGTINTTIALLIMLFGALHVRMPSKCAVYDNVGYTS